MGAIAAAFAVCSTYAQDEHKPADIVYELSVSPLYQTGADMDGGAEFRLKSVFWRFKLRRPVTPRFVAGINLKYDIDDYDFAGATPFGDTPPWNDVRRVGIGIPLFVRGNKDWGFGFTPSVDGFWEPGADFERSLSYGFTGFAAKSFARDKKLGFGVGVFRSIDGEFRVYPFPSVDWWFDRRWRLANPFDADALGPAGLELSYRFGERWQLGVGGVYRSFRFRLEDRGTVSDGIGSNSGTAVFLRLKREPLYGFDVSVFLGAVVGGELELEDEDGDDLASSDYDPAPFAAVTLGREF